MFDESVCRLPGFGGQIYNFPMRRDVDSPNSVPGVYLTTRWKQGRHQLVACATSDLAWAIESEHRKIGSWSHVGFLYVPGTLRRAAIVDDLLANPALRWECRPNSKSSPGDKHVPVGHGMI